MTYINVAMAQEQEKELGLINPASPEFGNQGRVRELNEYEANQMLAGDKQHGQEREMATDKILEGSSLEHAKLEDMEM